MIGYVLFIISVVFWIISIIAFCVFLNLCDRYNISYSDTKQLFKLYRNGSRFAFLRYYYQLAKHHRTLFLFVYYSFLFNRGVYAHVPTVFGIGLLLLILIIFFMMVLE